MTVTEDEVTADPPELSPEDQEKLSQGYWFEGHPCPNCGEATELPEDRSVFSGRYDTENRRVFEVISFFGCCFTLCEQYYRDNHPVLQDEWCSNCLECNDHCECYSCSYCGERVTDICGTCDRCDNHCHCYTCRGCQERVEDWCSNCSYCTDCCDCAYCESCCENVGHICSSCDSCSECCSCQSGIHSYDYKPEPEFFFVEDGFLANLEPYGRYEATDERIYLGLELEMEAVHCGASNLAAIWDDSGFGYAKHDGSLNDGVECVTHPHTYEALKKRDLAQTLSQLRSCGGRAWDTGTCGLHIHVSRKAFGNSKAHMWRFCAAMTNNQETLIKLAGRNDDSWSSWSTSRSPKPSKVVAVQSKSCMCVCGHHRLTHNRDSDPYDSYRKRCSGANCRCRGYERDMIYPERYVALNMQNTHTIECRFWRGSLHPQQVLGAAALTDGFVQWTKNMALADVRERMTWDHFCRWAQGNLPEPQWQDIVALAEKRRVQVPDELAESAA